MLITADHGNAEKMVDLQTGEPHTAHTSDQVPFMLVDTEHQKCNLKTGGSLRDVAPTILSLLNLDKPAEMTGQSLIK